MAIFSHATPDHVNWVVGLKQGMNANGVDVLTSWPLPDGKMLDSIIENYRPDVIFEINRHKDQIPETSNSFFHVCLIHEHRSHDTVYTNTSGNSDFYYSIITPSGFDFPKELDDKAKLFISGYNSEVIDHVNVQPKRYELGFAGFMGNPEAYKPGFVKSLINPSKPEFGTIQDLLKYIGIDKYLLNKSDYVFQVRRKTEAYFHARGVHDFKFSDYAYNQIFRMCEDGFVRVLNRKHICDLMLKTTNELAFWGTPMWKLWPQYAPYYKKELKSSRTLLEAYSSLKINIHCTGCNLHPRVIDTMAIGTPVAVMRMLMMALLGWIGFEPDVHYISYTFETFKKIKCHLKTQMPEPKLLKQPKRELNRGSLEGKMSIGTGRSGRI